MVYTAGKACRYKSWSLINDFCHKQNEQGIESFVRSLIKAGHESVLEHVSYTFFIEGISRNCSHQVVRHRIASVSQYSHRGVDDKLEMIIPEQISGELLDRWQKLCNEASQLYVDCHEEGVNWDEARYILPTGMTTSLVWTINVRSLRNFLKLRLSASASNEIRELANKILEIVMEEDSVFFEDVMEREIK